MIAATLQGCATLASGVATGPPGINPYSFRECLLHDGFFSREALGGIARADWQARHDDPAWRAGHRAAALPPAGVILDEPPASFVARSARVIADGLMPALEYWQPTGGDQAYAGHPSGGGNAPYVLVPAPDPYPRDGYAVGQAGSAGGGGTDRPDWRLNRFLDCYVAPVGGTAAADPAPIAPADGAPPPANGDDDVEGRLLRAHIVLALLARFGTEVVVSHASGRQVAQAELLLGHVAEAERTLRGASVVWSPDARRQAAGLVTGLDEHGRPAIGDDGRPARFADWRALAINLRAPVQPTLAWTDFSTRLLRVFQVGVDIERIDAEQSLDRFGNILAAFQGALGGDAADVLRSRFGSILKDSLTGLIGVQQTRLYGDAYLRDARVTLALHRRTTTVGDDDRWTYRIAAERDAWRLWDGEIGRACQVLATIAKKDVGDSASGGCIPDFAAPAPGGAAGPATTAAAPAPGA